jgi:hypothetical protein
MTATGIDQYIVVHGLGAELNHRDVVFFEKRYYFLGDAVRTRGKPDIADLS